MNKSYSELMSIESYIDRFRYLRIGGKVGEETFGYDRYLNQVFYTSREWKTFRNQIIVRNDNDMGMDGYPISGKIYIHHINPITLKDIHERSELLLDPENVVCVSYNTHNAIHYGDERLLYSGEIVRFANDTCPWR